MGKGIEMGKDKGFTLIELLVVISIIALLMAILMPALAKVRNQAKTVICQSNTKQFGLAFEMYTSTNNGFFGAGFATGAAGTPNTGGHRWPVTLESYYENRKLLLCPMAKKPSGLIFGRKFEAWDYRAESGNWSYTAEDPEGYLGSYGLNEWVSNADERLSGIFGEGNFWRTTAVANANNIPVLMDGLHPGHYPATWQTPPVYDGHLGQHGIKFFCIDRHNGHIDVLMLDSSVKKAGLKQLWTFAWRRGEDTANPYTIAGYGSGPAARAACAAYWDSKASWMKDMKEY